MHGSSLLALAASLLMSGCGGQEPKGGADPDTGAEPATTSTGTPAGTPSTPTTPTTAWDCAIDPAEAPDFSPVLGCRDDFDVLASDPLDASIPGAQSVKTVVDRLQDDRLYVQHSGRYPIHWEFCFEHLSGGGLPIVPDLSSFNRSEYYSPDRRFLLGAITWYEEPSVWVYEIAPYDTADADMVTTAFRQIRDAVYFGDALMFHPSSSAVEEVAEDLPPDIPVITTDELFADITYQPLNLATTLGKLTFYDDLDGELPWYRELLVLDAVPNDVSVVAGIVTSEFQTPLSHINVLSQNRGTPNMALKGAFEDPVLRGLEGLWVELTVEAMDWSIREVSQEEADAWWEANRPDPLDVGPMDLSVTDLVDAEDVLDLSLPLADALSAATPAFGGKASHFGGLTHIGDAVPVPDAFVVPVYFYDQFMTDNGLWPRVEAMLADPAFQGDPAVRDAELASLRDTIEAGVLAPGLERRVLDKLEADYPGLRMRFRSSTNAEDLQGFNGAGLYSSKSGDPGDPSDPVSEAILSVWASVWNFRAFEERAYFGIDHRRIGMALLVHPSFPDEEANGVAITANIYDVAGLEPGFYINVQQGEASVVFPEEGVTTDQLVYYFYAPGHSTVFLEHSNLVPEGEDVLSPTET
ncbi:MAG: hypothetical protein ACI9K2_004478, partial [Myxococcota bacterium]